MIRLATVFSGIGAPEAALEQMKVDFETVFACDNGERELSITYDEIMETTKDLNSDERVEYVNKLYEKTRKINHVKSSYFANHVIDDNRWYEDVRFIDGTKYTDKVDILVGGSPCQSFSTYGKKKGFEDTRGTLFFHYADLISKIKPKVFIYENVPGLKTHDKGKTWTRILEVFDELDYTTFFFTLNAKDYGLPQNRERIFVVGFKKQLGVLQFKEPRKLKLRKTSFDYLSKKVDLKYYMGRKGFEWVTTPEKNQRRSRLNQSIIGCQTANQQFNWTGDFFLEPPSERIREEENIFIGTYENSTCVARKLTPKECLRLMGFKRFKIVVNDKNAYRQSGNSIAVPVMIALFKSIFRKVSF